MYKSKNEIKDLERYSLKNNIGGVYFLFKDNKIVYVGQSTNIHARVRNHVDKDFDEYSFVIEERITRRKQLEAHYIDKFDPEYNYDKPDEKKLKEYADKTGAKEYGKKNTIGLIKSLHHIQRKNKLKKGWIYYNYLKKAEYYCKDDIRFLCSLLQYKKNWIKYKVKELKDDDKWIK